MNKNEPVKADDFYRAFEERYRGSRELIKGRLSVYLPFVKPLQEIYPDVMSLDVGCGRGEWLEVLRDIGAQALGVDLDDGMLQACRELDLAVKQGDAIAYLCELPDQSQKIISAFHVVEHIAFDQLRTFVSEALRVLKPGGLLIMETPNPENIIVATRNFYLDPTHQRPLPPDLLSFLPDYYGFGRSKIVRLQESMELLVRRNISLGDVLSGVSPDYAVIAQKKGDEKVFSSLDNCFSIEYGLTLDSLSLRYDAWINDRINAIESDAQAEAYRAEQALRWAQEIEKRAQLEAMVREANERADHDSKRAEQSEARAQRVEKRAQEALECFKQECERAQQAEERAQQAEKRAQQAEERVQQAEERVQQAEERVQQAEEHARLEERMAKQAQVHAQQAEYRAQQEARRAQQVYNSTSWRLTAPLRTVTQNFGLSKGSKLRTILQDPSGHAALYIKRRLKPRQSVFSSFKRLGFPSQRRHQNNVALETHNISETDIREKKLYIHDHKIKIPVDQLLQRIKKEINQNNV